MKKNAIILFAVLCSFAVKAQKPAYEKAMKELVVQIQSTIPGQGSFIPMANKMERIAAAETTEWLPKYWVAYCYSLENFSKTDAAEKDQLIDVADKYLAEAEKLSPENDEIEVLNAQVASSRLTVDPMNRWQKYGQIFSTALANAEKLNTNNPRIPYLKGVSLFYTPENFGGGKTPAKKLFENAQEKFASFEAKSDIYPNWGKMETEYFISQCN